MATCQKNTAAEPTQVHVSSHQNLANLDPALLQFDSLPDSAHVRLPVILSLFACSRATVWRHVKAGLIPAPVKFSERITTWNVGALRKHIMSRS